MGKKRRKALAASAPQAAVEPKRAVMISAEAAALLSRKVGKSQATREIFAPAQHPPAAMPAVTMAQDDALVGYGGWAGNQLASFGGYEGLPAPIPMTALAAMAQRAEFFKIADIPAREMTRRWIKITSVDTDGDRADRIKGIEEDLTRFKVRDAFRDAIRRDGLMGRGHVYIDTGEADKGSPIGNGRDAASRQKIRKGSLKSIRSLDPLWIYPQGFNAADPLQPDWYKPQIWRVMNQPVHASRLHTIVAREVPDILKPAYSFGGLSLTQVAEPYVANWLRTRQSVADIVSAFSVFVLKTNLMTGVFGQKTEDGAGLDARLTLFNLLRDNRGVMAIDKDAEDFMNVSANLGTLDQLQAQAQEQMASVASIPLVKLLGISPHGLNASSEGEIRVFYDDIHAAQEDHLRDPLQAVIDMIQLNRFGDVDETIRFHFEPLWTMGETERATIEKTKADRDAVYVQEGVLLPEEVRTRLATDEASDYPGLDLSLELNPPQISEQDDLPEVPEPEKAGETDHVS